MDLVENQTDLGQYIMMYVHVSSARGTRIIACIYHATDDMVNYNARDKRVCTQRTAEEWEITPNLYTHTYK